MFLQAKVFRRTYQTLAHLKNMADSMAQVQEGHSDPRTTMAYVKPANERRIEHARSMTAVIHLHEGKEEGF